MHEPFTAIAGQQSFKRPVSVLFVFTLHHYKLTSYDCTASDATEQLFLVSSYFERTN